MPLSQSSFNILQVALCNDPAANEISSAINTGNDSAILSVSDIGRNNINSTKQGLMVYDLDNDSLYSLQGNTITNASFNDSQLTYTINQKGPIGNNYILLYDPVLPNSNSPITVSLDSEFNPNGNYTVHVLVSQNFDNTVGQILQAFSGGALSFVLTVSLNNGVSLSDFANYGTGNFAGGTPAWGIVNQSAIISAANPVIAAAITANNNELATFFSTQHLSASQSFSVNGPSRGDGTTGKSVSNIGNTLFYEMWVGSPASNNVFNISDVVNEWFGGGQKNNLAIVDLTIAAYIVDNEEILGGNPNSGVGVWRRNITMGMTKNETGGSAPGFPTFDIATVYDFNNTGTWSGGAGATLGTPVITLTGGADAQPWIFNVAISGAVTNIFQFRLYAQIRQMTAIGF